MKLIEHLAEINCSSQNPGYIREALISRGITPSIGQVRQALRRLLASQSPATNLSNCPMCPDAQASPETHDQAYHDELQLALDNLRIAITETPPPFLCDCGNPTPHVTDAAKQHELQKNPA